MANPTGTWSLNDTQTGTPVRQVVITVVPRTSNRRFRFQVFDLTGAPLCAGEIVRQGPTDHFVFQATEGSAANGPLIFEPGATHPETGEPGVWTWQDLSTGEGGHLG